MKQCKRCLEHKEKEEFPIKGFKNKRSDKCYGCFRPYLKENDIKKRTPNSLNITHLNEIKQIYKKAVEMTRLYKVQFEVDHIVPIKGKGVSGLHVPWNLQIITAKANSKKSNNFDILNPDDDLYTEIESDYLKDYEFISK